jgi:5-methyltetrahydropteroyltriglutamate--homocysteine methyltransferase
VSADKPFFHADQVGSLLRPPSLLKAWAANQAGTLSDAELLALQDEAVTTAIAAQEALGFRCVVDGEFRRDVWWSEFITPAAIDGIAIDTSDPSTWFDKDRSAGDLPTYVPKRVRIEAKLARKRSIMGHAFAVMKAAATALPKITIPTPARFHFQYGYTAIAPEAYDDIEAFWEDVVAIYRAEIADLEAAGCRLIQIDDPVMSYFVDPKLQQGVRDMGAEPRQLLQSYVRAINAAVAERSPETTIAFHICRGNARGSWIASGGYDRIAGDVFPHLDVDTYFLEYDDERSGDFAPLALIPAGKNVALGLITTKRPEMEDVDELKRRVDEAAKYVPMEHLGISPQCGFASVLEGNPIAADVQQQKLELVVRVARGLWGSA